MTLTVVILAFNEAQHIGRAIASVKDVASHIVVVDSGSTDETAEIAGEMGAEVLTHPFVTQARQFNWALAQLPAETDWVFRLDADEIVSPELAEALATELPRLGPEIAGAAVARRIAFLRRPIRWGGVCPARITRVLRYGRGHSNDRWMDEHIILDGAEVLLRGELLDDNLNPLGWWVDKHNGYASREAVELLDTEYGFLGRGPRATPPDPKTGFNRWAKERIYARLPAGLRAVAYFFYRFVLRLGFLDGKEGVAFHVLQGFWYRFLVDIKLYEVKRYMDDHNASAPDAIEAVLGITLPATSASPRPRRACEIIPKV